MRIAAGARIQNVWNHTSLERYGVGLKKKIKV